MRTLKQITDSAKDAKQSNPFAQPYSETLRNRHNAEVVGKNMIEVAEGLAQKELTEQELIKECCELYMFTESREELYALVLFKKAYFKTISVNQYQDML